MDEFKISLLPCITHSRNLRRSMMVHTRMEMTLDRVRDRTVQIQNTYSVEWCSMADDVHCIVAWESEQTRVHLATVRVENLTDLLVCLHSHFTSRQGVKMFLGDRCYICFWHNAVIRE